MNELQNNGQGSRHGYTGKGIFLGASIGILVGLLVLNNTALGMGIGTSIGLIVGAILDANTTRSR